MKIYLDYSASAPIFKEAAERMYEYLRITGNPSSVHSYGREARRILEESREVISSEINAKTSEIFFFSSASEANNFIIFSATKAILKEYGNCGLYISPTEHASVFESFTAIDSPDVSKTVFKALKDGKVITDGLDLGTPGLISIIHTGNETGVINNIESIAEKHKKNNVFLHTDASQSFAKSSIDVKHLGVDYLTGSSHKIGGPHGTAFAYIKEGSPAGQIIFGGSQERNRRSGTENFPAAAGFAEAIKIWKKNRILWNKNGTFLKEMLLKGLNSIDNKGIINNSPAESSPFIASISFLPEYYKPDLESMLIFLDIKGVAVSGGSACASGSLKPSRILRAIGKSDDEAKATIRVSFGPGTTENDICSALEIFEKFSFKFRK